MISVSSFRVALGTSANGDERSQRQTLIRRISGVRWIGVVAAIALNRMPLTYVVIVGVALYNIVPFWFADRWTMRQLRLLGWILLSLDMAAAMLASISTIQQRNFPVLLLLLFFEASVLVGFESPYLSATGMMAVTLAALGYGSLALHFGDPWQDVVLWTLLCLFLGIRGALVARARWRYRQQLWADGIAASQSRDVATAESDETCTYADANPLSVREREILVLAARGLSNKEIASELFVSGRTVGTHMERIAHKLNAKNRCHAVAIALAHHWIAQLPLVDPGDGDVS